MNGSFTATTCARPRPCGLGRGSFLKKMRIHAEGCVLIRRGALIGARCHTWMAGSAAAARSTRRPMRPNPLMPILRTIAFSARVREEQSTGARGRGTEHGRGNAQRASWVPRSTPRVANRRLKGAAGDRGRRRQRTKRTSQKGYARTQLAPGDLNLSWRAPRRGVDGSSHRESKVIGSLGGLLLLSTVHRFSVCRVLCCVLAAGRAPTGHSGAG